MFSEQTAMRLQSLTGKRKKGQNDEPARRVGILTFQLQPFTLDMADALNVKSRLFNVRTAEPLQDVLKVDLGVALPIQQITVHEAPDIEKPTMVLRDVEVGRVLRVRQDKEGPIFSALFTVTIDYPSANDLLWLWHRVDEQIWVTFEDQQADLLSDGQQKPAAVKA